MPSASAQDSSGVTPPTRVAVHPHGLFLGASGGAPGQVLPLYAGAMHYFHHPREAWGRSLDAIRAMGLRLVDVYVPWGIHERAPGDYDFGQHDPKLDVATFLDMIHERRLLAIVRPGPHINAELTYFGLPERVVWDPDCQAKTPRGNPVVLPMLPLAFPVPSYASRAFHALADDWLMSVGKLLSGHRYPEGPIVMVQVDNEGALYFRDGPYDQDFHPDALALFRDHLRAKYGHIDALREAWAGAPNARAETFEGATPPARYDVESVEDATKHLDWVEFQELLLATGMMRFAHTLRASGLGEVPMMHNLPPGEAGTSLNAEKLSRAVDLVGLDYYHRASAETHVAIVRRTTELAARNIGEGTPAYGAEVGTGFPPFFPVHDEEDSFYTLVTALAYGLRGFNLYMAVERDRWLGSPIDSAGRARPFAARLRRLVDALEAAEFHALVRETPACLVVPRSLRRLARATHAFGPLSPAVFNVAGAGFEASCLESGSSSHRSDPRDPRASNPAIAGEAFLRAFEGALLRRGVPFAYVGGEATRGLDRARFVVASTAGGMKPDLIATLRAARARGAAVTIGPTLPKRDGAMRTLADPVDVGGLDLASLDDVAEADAIVARRIVELGLPTYPVHPASVWTTLHHDRAGVPRVAFVMNPERAPARARVSFPGLSTLEDLLEGEPAVLGKSAGAFDVEMGPRAVRMFRVT